MFLGDAPNPAVSAEPASIDGGDPRKRVPVAVNRLALAGDRGAPAPERSLEIQRDRDRDVVAVDPGRDLDAERQPVPGPPERHLGHRHALQG